MAGSRRTERVGGQLREEISLAIQRVVKDPRIRGVTVTDVELSKDLRYARVYYSVIGEDERKEEARRGLQSARGLIRRELGRNLPLRYVPDMEFFFDASFEHADHIENLLRKIQDTES